MSFFGNALWDSTLTRKAAATQTKTSSQRQNSGDAVQKLIIRFIDNYEERL
jgi:hypothetical protein